MKVWSRIIKIGSRYEKKFSFEVSIELLTLFLIVTKNKPCSESLEQNLLRWSQEMEQNIEF